jgi:hypothetical protein
VSEQPTDTNITLVARISQKQTAEYSQTNVIGNTKPTQQGSKDQRWQLRRSTRARLSHITRNKSSYVYERYTATNGGIIAAFRNVAFNDTKNFRLDLHITFLHIKYVGSNLLRSTPTGCLIADLREKFIFLLSSTTDLVSSYSTLRAC